MKNLIGVMFSIIGVFLVGVGSYVYFENYGYYLESSLKNNLYEGVYKNDDNNIVIKDNNIYINEESGLEITINGNELKLSKDGEIVMICYK